MSNKVALCADSNCLKNPIDLGLQGERILDQTWILPFADALIARQYLREHPVAETWVVSSDSIDGINLAAALKKDNQDKSVRLFLPSPSGSKMSRCQNAGIIPICGSREFAHLYAAKKFDNVAPERIQPTHPVSSPGSRSTPPSTQPHARTGSAKQYSSHKPDPVPQAISEQATSPDRPDRTSEQPVSKVTVTRIERNSERPTGPLPTIDIDEIPMLTKVQDAAQAPSTAPVEETPLPTRANASSRAIKVLERSASVNSEGATIITVVSGSGGTGKSSIAAMSALLAQKRGIRTLLLDADFQFGDLKYLLGYKQALATDDILEHPEQIDSLLKVDTWPALLAAPTHLEHSELMDERIGELLNYLKPHFDLIVANTGSSWSDLQVQLLEASNNVFFLVDQRPSSIRACNHALDLCSRCGIATTSFSYLLNFCSKKSLLSSLDVSCALKGAKVFEIKDGGVEVGELFGAGMAHKLSRINNSFCTSVEQLLIETVYDRVKASLSPSVENALEKHGPAEGKVKLRSRQKRRAACF